MQRHYISIFSQPYQEPRRAFSTWTWRSLCIFGVHSSCISFLPIINSKWRYRNNQFNQFYCNHQGHSIFSATIEIKPRCMSFYQIYSPDFQSEVVGMKLTLGKFHKKIIIFIDSRVVSDLNLFIVARGCHCTKNKVFH